ncbi:MAG: DUF177 domain-containing protein [Phreatobacter sp.]|uniref:YceD family protein n=1 Tax=Phreatobacter sp. TaxID=1966341 RepID=UPI002732B3DA|nr:DUF177 domain-containing protein [Phreatobacter sp.]MDP2802075.1 DUF177 domain-containing protein [Phreatobacter sp.]
MTGERADGGRRPGAPLPRWPIRVVDVSASGVHVRRRSLTRDDLAIFAAFLGVDAMTAFDLDVHVKPFRGDGLAVTGKVSATVMQTCVVTLEPMVNTIAEEVEASFRPEEKLKVHLVHDEEDGLAIDASVAADDPLVGGVIDVAAVAAEFLALGVDHYPRKPDADFQPPEEGGEASPFAGLSKLKRDT